MRRPNEREVATEADVGRGDGLALAFGVADAELVDQERDAVDAGVEEERVGPDGLEQLGSDDEPDAQAGQRGALEAGGGLAPQHLAAGGGQGDEPENRRDARGGRGPLEQARGAEDRQARRQPGQDRRNRAEHRSVEHHAVVAEPVGQDAEDR